MRATRRSASGCASAHASRSKAEPPRLVLLLLQGGFQDAGLLAAVAATVAERADLLPHHLLHRERLLLDLDLDLRIRVLPVDAGQVLTPSSMIPRLRSVRSLVPVSCTEQYSAMSRAGLEDLELVVAAQPAVASIVAAAARRQREHGQQRAERERLPCERPFRIDQASMKGVTLHMRAAIDRRRNGDRQARRW